MKNKKQLDSVWMTVYSYTGRRIDRFALSTDEIEQVLVTTYDYDQILSVIYDQKEANRIVAQKHKELEAICLAIIKRIHLEKYEQPVTFPNGDLIILNLQ